MKKLAGWIVTSVVLLTAPQASMDACIGCAYKAVHAVAMSPLLNPAATVQKGKASKPASKQKTEAAAPSKAPAAARTSSVAEFAAKSAGVIMVDTTMWRPSKQQHSANTDVQFDHSTGNGYMTLASQSNFAPIAAYSESFIKDVQESNPGSTIVEQADKVVNGSSFRTIRFELPVSESVPVPVGYLVAITSNKHGVFILSCYSAKELIDEFVPDFLAVLNSYKKPA
ncbi:MAG: hypothetical protein MUC47_08295 [Candidatus Kapabacteria bacterium]|jgi:hypothetical protein|nr:hypothetical protein [Candidatus Kapabacteria bacterium]